jgi:hypothetical protein
LPLSFVCRFESAFIRAIRGQNRLGIGVYSRGRIAPFCAFRGQ